MFANYCFEDGAIGVPMPYTGIKLADVSEMGYHAAEGKGEICFRGHNVMKGMVKNKNWVNNNPIKSFWTVHIPL